MTRDTNKCAHRGIFNHNFGHPICTVIIEHSQQKCLITNRQYMLLKPKNVVATVMVHVVNIIPFCASNNARRTYVNKIDILHNIVSHQATKGFFSNLWSPLATRDMYHPTKTDEQKGSIRMQQVIQATYAHNVRIWRSRNDALHSSTTPQLADIRSAEFAEIQQIHGEPNSLCLADRHMCEGSLERLLGGSATTRRRWLRRVKRSIVRHQREGKTQTRITQFFTTHTG